MASHSINFEHWRRFSTLKIWEVAALMQGLEPRCLDQFVNAVGDGPDLDDDIRALRAATDADQLLASRQTGTSADDDTELRVDSLIPWLRDRGYDELAGNLAPAPRDSGAGPNEVTAPEINVAVLATPDDLLAAFRQWGLKPDWFNNPKDHPWLLDARRVKGHGQRGHGTPPLYCPRAVMEGLATRTRRRTLTVNTGWRVLEGRFPLAYALHAEHDPRTQSG